MKTETETEAETETVNGLAIGALVSSIIGFIILPILFSPVGIILGCISLVNKNHSAAPALWAIGLGVLGVLFMLVNLTAILTATN